jgi:serine/threonine-protein kinase
MAVSLDVEQSILSSTDQWYLCVQHLGTGGNAVTYLVLATSGKYKGSLFALKIFQRVSDADRLHKFHKEIDFLEKCSHPSIMRVYDSGVFIKDGQSHPFVVMEYLPHHLHTEIRKVNLDTTAKLSIATQLTSALSYLDSLEPKIIHRDIKPQNIFIKGKTCVLGDFGMMKVCDPEISDATQDRADMSSYIGIPFYYRTPDLVSYTKGESQLSTASDIFQLGLVLTELFSGRNPCRVPGTKLDPVILDRITHIPGELGGQISGILSSMLSMSPNERPSPQLLLDRWNGAFQRGMRLAHALNGKAL